MANRWRLTIEKPFCYRMRWFVLETTIAGRLLIYFLLFISSNITTLTAKRSAMDAAVTPATPMPVYISITDECIVSTEAYIHICSITVLFNVKKTFNCLRGCDRTYNSFLLIKTKTRVSNESIFRSIKCRLSLINLRRMLNFRCIAQCGISRDEQH